MTTSKPLQVSDLIFSNASNDVNKILGNIRRSNLTISNRLWSIEKDAEFVETVSRAYALLLVANERCGSWYIPPDRKTQSAYFKSTDGHNGQWSFSLRRLNIQVLETVIEHGGCVVVDSTRRGKSMPDALSKTVPIWICVWNRVLFPERREAHILHTPPSVVTPSEHNQIEARINDFVSQLRALDLDLDTIETKLKKPLRPLWVTQESSLPLEPPSFSDFHPIVLCTASRQVPGGESSGDGYIQGAADDSESWARGLTAPLFWAHKDTLLATCEDDLPSLITSLASQTNGTSSHSSSTISPTTQVSVGTIPTAKDADIACSLLITCSAQNPLKPQQIGSQKSKHLDLTCSPGKVGSRQLRHELPKLLSVLDNILQTPDASPSVLIACPTGKDHSLGIALAILCLYAADNGVLRPRDPHVVINKQFIKQRLSWIMVSLPDANPSRATLQSVNAFLLG